MDKESIRQMITSMNVDKTAEELKVNKSTIFNVRYIYKCFTNGSVDKVEKRITEKNRLIFGELMREEVKLSVFKQGRNNKSNITEISGEKITGQNKILSTCDPYGKLDESFNTFKGDLVEVLAVLIEHISTVKINEAYRRGKAEGALETQAKFIEEGKKSNLSDMLRKKLMGM